MYFHREGLPFSNKIFITAKNHRNKQESFQKLRCEERQKKALFQDSWKKDCRCVVTSITNHLESILLRFRIRTIVFLNIQGTDRSYAK